MPAHTIKALSVENGRPVYYRYRKVRCHRPACGRCPHGPYLYKRAYVLIGRRYHRKWSYVGKIGSSAEQAVLTVQLAAEAERKRSRSTVPF